jgi:hypothetical protein
MEPKLLLDVNDRGVRRFALLSPQLQRCPLTTSADSQVRFRLKCGRRFVYGCRGEFR